MTRPRRRRAARRAIASFALVSLGLVGLAEPAAADAAGPTDYRTEIVDIDPAVDAIELAMIGGDSFIQLTVVEPVEVMVVGYQGEPYLMFDADGTVWQNERSPSRWLNDDRYAESVIPEDATADAAPDWHLVGGDGSYAWHDHRTHWMNRAKPPGAEPGDTVLEAVVPLVVDGDEVMVTVQSVLLASPAPWPALLGGIGALALTGALVLWLGPQRGVTLSVFIGATTALVFGLLAHRSVPSETGPSASLWLLPLVSLAAVALALVIRRRRPSAPTLPLLVGLAGAELGVWGWSRRDAVSRALIPTDAPQSLDRLVIVAWRVSGGVAVVAAVLAWGRRPAPAPADGSAHVRGVGDGDAEGLVERIEEHLGVAVYEPTDVS